MWTYKQVSGELSHEGEHVCFGYSGYGADKNEPESQHKHGLGPIPRGLYVIEEPRDTVTHGPYVMPLTPHPENVMFGRSAFLIHGDSIHDPGTASHGCIILAKLFRLKVWDSGDRLLQVVSGLD